MTVHPNRFKAALHAGAVQIGIIASDIADARRYSAQQRNFVAVGSDVGLLAEATAQLADHFKSKTITT